MHFVLIHRKSELGTANPAYGSTPYTVPVDQQLNSRPRNTSHVYTTINDNTVCGIFTYYYENNISAALFCFAESTMKSSFTASLHIANLSAYTIWKNNCIINCFILKKFKLIVIKHIYVFALA